MKKITIIILILLGCSDNNETPNYINISSDSKYIDFSQYVDSISVVKMEQKQEYYLSDYQSSFHKNDSLLYFIDQGQKKLYVFNSNGDAVNKFDRIGNAKNEYIDIEDFAFLNNKIYVLCFPYKLFILNNKLEIEKVLKFNHNFKRIIGYNNNLYMYSHDDRALFLFNSSDGTVEQLLIDKRKNNKVSFYPQPVFNIVEDSLLLINIVGSDILYSINQHNNIDSKYTLQYKDKEYLYRKTDNIDLNDVLNQMKYAKPSIENIIKGNRYLYIIYSFKATFRLLVIDSYLNAVIEDGIIKNTIQNRIPRGGIDNSFYSIFYVNNNEIQHITKYNYRISSSIDNDEDLVLCTYYMK